MALTLGSLSSIVPRGKNKPALHPKPKLSDVTQWWQRAMSPFLAIYLLVFPMTLPHMRQVAHSGPQFHCGS